MKVALAVMVKDEEAVLPRLLDSVTWLVDEVIALDTGSTDGTVDILLGAGATLYQTKFEDFGRSRTQLMRLARGRADYLLLLDADMTLRVEGNLPALTADGYMLRHNCQPEYRVPRLVRGDIDWRFVGATHEYLEAPHTVYYQSLDVWSVAHHGDGASRPEKFTRDQRLLLAEWEERPTDRVAFYLANTYRDLGMRDEAIEWYRRRVEMGGWGEECYVAQLELGKLTQDKDDLIAAYQMRPTRREALRELWGLTPPSDDILFVSN